MNDKLTALMETVNYRVPVRLFWVGPRYIAYEFPPEFHGVLRREPNRRAPAFQGVRNSEVLGTVRRVVDDLIWYRLDGENPDMMAPQPSDVKIAKFRRHDCRVSCIRDPKPGEAPADVAAYFGRRK